MLTFVGGVRCPWMDGIRRLRDSYADHHASSLSHLGRVLMSMGPSQRHPLHPVQLEGTVSSSDKRIKLMANELEQLKVRTVF